MSWTISVTRDDGSVYQVPLKDLAENKLLVEFGAQIVVDLDGLVDLKDGPEIEVVVLNDDLIIKHEDNDTFLILNEFISGCTTDPTCIAGLTITVAGEVLYEVSDSQAQEIVATAEFGSTTVFDHPPYSAWSDPKVIGGLGAAGLAAAAGGGSSDETPTGPAETPVPPAPAEPQIARVTHEADGVHVLTSMSGDWDRIDFAVSVLADNQILETFLGSFSYERGTSPGGLPQFTINPFEVVVEVPAGLQPAGTFYVRATAVLGTETATFREEFDWRNFLSDFNDPSVGVEDANYALGNGSDSEFDESLANQSFILTSGSLLEFQGGDAEFLRSGQEAPARFGDSAYVGAYLGTTLRNDVLGIVTADSTSL